MVDIILINDYGFYNGGGAAVAIGNAVALANRGHDIHFLFAVEPAHDALIDHPKIQVYSTGQHDILSSRKINAAIQGLWNFKGAALMKDITSKLENHDVLLHIHGWTKALSPSVIAKAIQALLPIVITAHDYFLTCPNGGFYNYRTQAVCPLRPLSLQCITTNCDKRNYAQKIWRVVRAIIQRRVFSKSKKPIHVIFVSRTSEQLQKPYMPANMHTHLLPNLIDTTHAARIPVEDNQTLYAIGRLSPEKGYDLLAQITHKLGLPVCFIGTGPMQEVLSKLNPNARFTGWLSQEAMQRELQNARMLIFPSRIVETQGLVVQEAASMGIPSIASDITAAREFILPGDTGLICKANDLQDLATQILTLMDDETLKHMSQRTYEQYWTQHVTPEEYVQALEAIYNQVLG